MAPTLVFDFIQSQKGNQSDSLHFNKCDHHRLHQHRGKKEEIDQPKIMRKKVQVGKDQEKAQSEKDSTPKTKMGKKTTIRYLYHENI